VPGSQAIEMRKVCIFKARLALESNEWSDYRTDCVGKIRAINNPFGAKGW